MFSAPLRLPTVANVAQIHPATAAGGDKASAAGKIPPPA